MRSSFAIATLLSVACVVNAANTVVMVGQNQTLTFSPTTLTGVKVNDTITFQFQSKNHTATQSSFAQPCSQLAGGANSGFQPIPANATMLSQFTITVNKTTPMWFFCAQTNPLSHCGKGMVFAVNPPATGNTFEAFQAAAELTANSTSTSASASPTSSGLVPSSTSLTSSATSTSAASTSTASSSAMKVGYSASSALTAVALLVGLTF